MQRKTKKRIIFSAFMAALCGVTITTMANVNIKNLVRSTEGGVDCNYYFNNQGDTITSLYDVNYMLYQADLGIVTNNSVTTWGTVSKIINKTDSSGNAYVDALIQSTDKYGHVAGISLHNIDDQISDIAVGDFLEITGKAALYSGMPQFACKTSTSGYATATRITKNSYEVEPLLTQQGEIATYLSYEYNKTQIANVGYRKYLSEGLALRNVNNVYIKSVSGNNAVFVIKDNDSNDVELTAFTGKVGTTDKNALNTYLSENVGSYVDIQGAFCPYKNSTTYQIQFCLYSVDDLVAYSGMYSSFVLNKNEYNLYSIGSSTYLEADISYTGDHLDWTVKSMDTSVFEIQDDITIVATGFGTARGYFEYDSSPFKKEKLYFTVNVQKLTLTKFEIQEPNPCRVSKGYNSFSVSYEPYVGSIDIVWSCDLEGYDCSNYGYGNFYFKVEKHYIITATYGEYSDSIEVIVGNGGDPIPVTGVTVDNGPFTIEVGEVTSLMYTVSPTDADDFGVTFSSSDESVATVSSYGDITGVGIGEATITVRTDDGGYTDSTTVSVVAAAPKTTTVNRTTMSVGNYNTNFGTATVDGFKTAFYRVGNNNTTGGFYLYPSAKLDSTDERSLQGAIYNEAYISGITDITIEYQSTTPMTLRTGVSKKLNNSIIIPASTSMKTTKFTLESKANYYSVEATMGIGTINSITITYDNSLENVTATPFSVNDTKRIDPVRYTGTLVDGESYVDVPTAITISGNKYTVKSTKRYTYYSWSYVQEHASELDLSEIAMTTPEDVSNYYIAFGAAPANYAAKNTITQSACSLGSVADVNSVFGTTYARCLQEFTRTTGYAKAVPYAKASGKSYPYYLEFDIASNSNYTTTARDVTRVVMWTTGWSTYGSGIPVATFTDDHYVTFAEYTNYGTWGEYFDTLDSSYSSVRTNRILGTTTTLVAA